jgi:hypothetical protein
VFVDSRVLLKFGLAVAVANFLLSVATNALIGGDALHARPSGRGLYLLQNSGHVIAVGVVVYKFAIAQIYSLIVTFPFGLWCAWRISQKSRHEDDAA